MVAFRPAGRLPTSPFQPSLRVDLGEVAGPYVQQAGPPAPFGQKPADRPQETATENGGGLPGQAIGLGERWMLRDGSSSDRVDPRQAGQPASPSTWPQGASCDLGTSALVCQQVIPLLVAAHVAGEESPGSPQRLAQLAARAIDAEQVADLALAQDAHVLLERLEAALAAGDSVEDLMVDVLAPAARILGVRWEADLADFVDVTMGLWRLQEVVHALSSRRRPLRPDRAAGCRILCTVMPGDQHGFGSILLEEMFRHAGWMAVGHRDADAAELLAHVGQGWFDLIALTASIDQPIAHLRETIAALRYASANPAVGILVGGHLFSSNPGLADAIGADATARDGKAAIEVAAAVVARLAPQRMALPHRSHQTWVGDQAMRGSARLG